MKQENYCITTRFQDSKTLGLFVETAETASVILGRFVLIIYYRNSSGNYDFHPDSLYRLSTYQ